MDDPADVPREKNAAPSPSPSPARSQSGHFTDTPLGSHARLLTDVIVSLNILVFVLQITCSNTLHLTEEWVNVHALVDQGQVYRLATAMVLHGSWPHLILNNLSLHSLGSLCEWTCGKKRFLLIYILSGIGGNVASYLATGIYAAPDGEPIASLGASGAIFGIAGALIVYFMRNGVLYRDKGVPSGMLNRLLLTVSANFVLGSFLPNIDEAGHWGGLVAGALLAAVLGPHYELCKLRGHDAHEVWLVDDSLMGRGETPRLVYVIPEDVN